LDRRLIAVGATEVGDHSACLGFRGNHIFPFRRFSHPHLRRIPLTLTRTQIPPTESLSGMTKFQNPYRRKVGQNASGFVYLGETESFIFTGISIRNFDSPEKL
jgi:hypothetical protein